MRNLIGIVINPVVIEIDICFLPLIEMAISIEVYKDSPAS